MVAVLPVDVTSHTLGGWALDQRDADGVLWLVDRLDGWAGADVRLSADPRPGEHGAFAPSVLYGPRTLQLEGRIEAPTLPLRRAAEDRLSALTNALGGVPLRVDEPPLSRQAAVWRAGRLSAVVRGTTARYTLPLVAPDPRKYDVAEQNAPVGLLDTSGMGFSWPLTFPINFGSAGTGGDVNVTNTGNADTWPVLILTGPALNPVVRNNTTGERLTFSIDLPAGSFLEVDAAERTVLLDGTANRRTALSSGSSWPRIAPGPNTFQFRASTYSALASLVVRFRSAWL